MVVDSGDDMRHATLCLPWWFCGGVICSDCGDVKRVSGMAVLALVLAILLMMLLLLLRWYLSS